MPHFTDHSDCSNRIADGLGRFVDFDHFEMPAPEFSSRLRAPALRRSFLYFGVFVVKPSYFG
jgi:hypothetical protein